MYMCVRAENISRPVRSEQYALCLRAHMRIVSSSRQHDYSLHVLDASTVAVLGERFLSSPTKSLQGPAAREVISPAVCEKCERLKNIRLNRLALAFPSRLLS